MIIFSVLIFVLKTLFFGGRFLIYHLSKSMTGWLSGRSTEHRANNSTCSEPCRPLNFPSLLLKVTAKPATVGHHSQREWLREWEGFKQPFSLLEKQS